MEVPGSGQAARGEHEDPLDRVGVVQDITAAELSEQGKDVIRRAPGFDADAAVALAGIGDAPAAESALHADDEENRGAEEDRDQNRRRVVHGGKS